MTVIAAHCATSVFPPVEKNQIKELYAMMKDVNGDATVQLWADTSALSLSTRIPLIPEILETFPPSGWSMVLTSPYPSTDGLTYRG